MNPLHPILARIFSNSHPRPAVVTHGQPVNTDRTAGGVTPESLIRPLVIALFSLGSKSG
ncbi:MAG: hypothetical protein A4E49_00417 [Methanosaeta sp. PtaU1.Bin112]|nr:MAG: hypothetical protein A4E49_00417 [Methanosaeta sp. PtaU1.Bin112]